MQEEVLKIGEDENIEEYNSITIKAKKTAIDNFRNLCLEYNKSQGEMLDILIAEHKDIVANQSSNDYVEHTLFVKKSNSVDDVENIVFKGRKIFDVSYRPQVKVPDHFKFYEEELFQKPSENSSFSTEVYLTPKGNYILYIQWLYKDYEDYASLYYKYKKSDANILANRIFNLLTPTDRNKLYQLLGKTVVLEDS